MGQTQLLVLAEDLSGRSLALFLRRFVALLERRVRCRGPADNDRWVRLGNGNAQGWKDEARNHAAQFLEDDVRL
jgi:hypothetical protein